MRIHRLIPKAVAVDVADFGDRKVGSLTLIGAGDFADVALQVLLDPTMLGQLEAQIAEVRVRLVRSTV